MSDVASPKVPGLSPAKPQPKLSTARTPSLKGEQPVLPHIAGWPAVRKGYKFTFPQPQPFWGKNIAREPIMFAGSTPYRQESTEILICSCTEIYQFLTEILATMRTLCPVLHRAECLLNGAEFPLTLQVLLQLPLQLPSLTKLLLRMHETQLFNAYNSRLFIPFFPYKD